MKGEQQVMKDLETPECGTLTETSNSIMRTDGSQDGSKAPAKKANSYLTDRSQERSKVPAKIADSSLTDVSQDRSKAPERSLKRTVATRALQGVVLHAFQIGEEGDLHEIDDAFDALFSALAEERAGVTGKKLNSYWVDLDADERDREEVNEWIEELNLGSFVTAQMTKPTDEWVSHVVRTRSKALIMIRILPMINDDGIFVTKQVEFLAALKSKNLLLTYTTTTSGGRRSLNKESIGYMTQEECLQDGSSSAALISWLEFHIFRTQKAILQLRKQSVELVARMDDEPSSVPLDEILQIRDMLLVTLAVAEEQSQCLCMIKTMDEDTDAVSFDKLKGALSILVSTGESTERTGLRLEKRMYSLKHSYDSHQQDRINRRLAILTVVSTIFMPLTFMAGIYGMNFVNMPELDMENGYSVLLASMLAITVTMLLFFYSHGWFV